MQVATTTLNLQRHKTVLPFQDLPATVKDAITVASKLGIRRLWIDSLCIIQDGNRDQAWEITKMPLIYSQATITIAATHAKGVYDGFLMDGKPRAGFKLPYQCRNGKAGSVIFFPESRSLEYNQALETVSTRNYIIYSYQQ